MQAFSYEPLIISLELLLIAILVGKGIFKEGIKQKIEYRKRLLRARQVCRVNKYVPRNFSNHSKRS